MAPEAVEMSLELAKQAQRHVTVSERIVMRIDMQKETPLTSFDLLRATKRAPDENKVEDDPNAAERGGGFDQV